MPCPRNVVLNTKVNKIINKQNRQFRIKIAFAIIIVKLIKKRLKLLKSL